MHALPSAPGKTIACSFRRLGGFALATAGLAASDDAPASGGTALRLCVSSTLSALFHARAAAGRPSCGPSAARCVAALAPPSSDASCTCSQHASFVSGVDKRLRRQSLLHYPTRSLAAISALQPTHARLDPLLAAGALAFTCRCFAAAISSQVLANILRVQRISAFWNLSSASLSTIGCWSEAHTRASDRQGSGSKFDYCPAPSLSVAYMRECVVSVGRSPTRGLMRACG